MDELQLSIAPGELYAQLGRAEAPVVVDARREAASANGRLLVAAAPRSADTVQRWRGELPIDRQVVVYGVNGDKIAGHVAVELRAVGIRAQFLEGGIEGWIGAGLPTRRAIAGFSSQWITRERPKIDRIACPWLIRRFIDPGATFIYVPSARVRDSARDLNAIPFDIEGVEFGHEGDCCSFDAFLRIFDIRDQPLDRLALIVRGADTSRHDLTPQCSGLLAISQGLSAIFSNDHQMLECGMIVYNALYAWCRSQQHENHS